MTRPSLAGIEKRAAEATPGPWARVPTEGNAVVSPDRGGYWTGVADRIETEPNAAFIADARTTVPALAAAVRDVLALAERLDRLAARHLDSDTGRIETAVAHELRTALAAHLDLTDPEGDPT